MTIQLDCRTCKQICSNVNIFCKYLVSLFFESLFAWGFRWFLLRSHFLLWMCRWFFLWRCRWLFIFLLMWLCLWSYFLSLLCCYIDWKKQCIKSSTRIVVNTFSALQFLVKVLPWNPSASPARRSCHAKLISCFWLMCWSILLTHYLQPWHNQSVYNLHSVASSIRLLIGASLSEPHTSVTALRTCVCTLACLLAAIYRKFWMSAFKF